MPRLADTGFDTAVLDRENQTVALVLVKAHPVGNNWTAFLPTELKSYASKVDFVLTVDPTNIHLFQWNGTALNGPIVDLNTTHVLQHYEPDFANLRVFQSYLVTLVEAWLRDLAYHWKSENPPGWEELRTVGLLSKMEEGTTLSLGE